MIQILRIFFLSIICFQFAFADSIEVVRQRNAFELISQKLVSKLVKDSVEALHFFIKEPPKTPVKKNVLQQALYEKRLIVGPDINEIKVSEYQNTEIHLRIRKEKIVISYKNFSQGILWINNKKFSLLKAQYPEYIENFVQQHFSEKKYSILDFIIPKAQAAVVTTVIVGLAIILLVVKSIMYVNEGAELGVILAKTLKQCLSDKTYLQAMSSRSIEQNETVKFLTYMKEIAQLSKDEVGQSCESLKNSFWNKWNSRVLDSFCTQTLQLSKCLLDVSAIKEVQEYSSSGDRNVRSKDINGTYKQLIEKSSFAQER